jgi:hypothetical protein
MMSIVKTYKRPQFEPPTPLRGAGPLTVEKLIRGANVLAQIWYAYRICDVDKCIAYHSLVCILKVVIDKCRKPNFLE